MSAMATERVPLQPLVTPKVGAAGRRAPRKLGIDQTWGWLRACRFLFQPALTTLPLACHGRRKSLGDADAP